MIIAQRTANDKVLFYEQTLDFCVENCRYDRAYTQVFEIFNNVQPVNIFVRNTDFKTQDFYPLNRH